MKKFITLSMLLTLCSTSVFAADYSPYVDQQGEISLPEDFRKRFAHLGSWFVPKGDASGFHDVYTQQDTIEHFRKTGDFPDGAVLVKELRAASSGHYTTGSDVSYANDQVKQWFVMVKDTKSRFAGNPLWGDGWGWALFKPDNPARNLTNNYKSDCLGCHVPAKADDWVYTEAYPVLSK